jgi:hypothetical protein
MFINHSFQQEWTRVSSTSQTIYTAEAADGGAVNVHGFSRMFWHVFVQFKQSVDNILVINYI